MVAPLAQSQTAPATSVSLKTKVRVVTDSTASLPPGVAEQLRIFVVPLQIHLGHRSGWEGVDVLPADVCQALQAKSQVTISPPTPQAFTSAFTAASALGREPTPFDVVAILMSGQLSQTVLRAREGLQPLDSAGVQIQVLDAQATSMAMGFAVIAAATAAAEGHSAKMVSRRAEDALRRTDAFFYADSLDQLRRNGRIGATTRFLGTAVSSRPLFGLHEGRIEQLEKVSGEARAMTRLVELASDRAGRGPVELAVHHLAAPERAAALAAKLQQRFAGQLHSLVVVELGAVLGARLGPGLAGVVLHRLQD